MRARAGGDNIAGKGARRPRSAPVPRLALHCESTGLGLGPPGHSAQPTKKSVGSKARDYPSHPSLEPRRPAAPRPRLGHGLGVASAMTRRQPSGSARCRPCRFDDRRDEFPHWQAQSSSVNSFQSTKVLKATTF